MAAVMMGNEDGTLGCRNDCAGMRPAILMGASLTLLRFNGIASPPIKFVLLLRWIAECGPSLRASELDGWIVEEKYLHTTTSSSSSSSNNDINNNSNKNDSS